MYLWVAAPAGETSEGFAARLLEHGVLVAPGSFLGGSGEGYVRFALVPDRRRVRAGRRDPRPGALTASSARAVPRIRRESGPMELARQIDEMWETGSLDAAVGRGARSGCSTTGAIRVAEPDGGRLGVNEWVKKAILLYFRVRKVEPMDVGGLHFLDKIPVKSDYADRGVRVVPPGVARYGSFLSEGCVLMPGYVNIGAWVGPRTMVDTWATVGSCAQIGADVHLAGGVGIGGVLEPPQAAPVIVEDGAFIGSRAVIVEGVRIGAGAVIAPNVVLSASVPIIDVTGPEPVEYRGEVPPRKVVLPGVRQKEFPAGSYGLPCALIVGERKRLDGSEDVAQRRAARVRDRRLTLARRLVPGSRARSRESPPACRSAPAARSGRGWRCPDARIRARRPSRAVRSRAGRAVRAGQPGLVRRRTPGGRSNGRSSQAPRRPSGEPSACRTCSTTKNAPCGVGVAGAPTTTRSRSTSLSSLRRRTSRRARITTRRHGDATSLAEAARIQPVRPFGRPGSRTRSHNVFRVVEMLGDHRQRGLLTGERAHGRDGGEKRARGPWCLPHGGGEEEPGYRDGVVGTGRSGGVARRCQQGAGGGRDEQPATNHPVYPPVVAVASASTITRACADTAGALPAPAPAISARRWAWRRSPSTWATYCNVVPGASDAARQQ